MPSYDYSYNTLAYIFVIMLPKPEVGVGKSSIYKLSLQLVSSGSQIINAGEIELGIFVPRSGTKYIVRENTLPESLPVPLDIDGRPQFAKRSLDDGE